MPISDSDSYSIGHFKRVYEYIIKPACLKAEFEPIRADDILNTNYIAIDVIKRIISSEMAICDLSSRNPNVFYELGIRQAFNLPVTLIRDTSTERVFDIQGFRDIEYDQNLRIDNVEQVIGALSETITNTYNSKGKEINSLISLLGIHPAQVTTNIEISRDTEVILNSILSLGSRLEQVEKFIPMQQKKSAFTIDEKGGIWKELTIEDHADLQTGDIIEHRKFGKGKVLQREGTVANPIVAVFFDYNGEKKLMLNYVKGLQKLIKSE
jgi:hypothetical protein